MFKRAKVAMLTTNQKANLALGKSKEGKLVYYVDANFNNDKYIAKQHLYFLSDEEIKLGDYYFDFRNDGNRVEHFTTKEDVVLVGICGSKKIIATTDTTLNLPQPSQQFIQKYIEEYNKGNVITDVLVEYKFNDFNFMATLCTTKEKEYILKINPKDNTITIRKIKDSYTREEALSLAQRAFSKGESYGVDKTRNPDYYMYLESPLKSWIEENF